MQITCCGFSGLLFSNDATDVYDEGNCAMVPHEVHIAEFDLGSFSMAFPHLGQYSDINKLNSTQLGVRTVFTSVTSCQTIYHRNGSPSGQLALAAEAEEEKRATQFP
jgi:hypothetical protein